jgi:multidrug efflux pump subunit AcrA (membrane-fusion protein)
MGEAPVFTNTSHVIREKTMKKKLLWAIIILIVLAAIYRIGVFVMGKVNPKKQAEEQHTVPVKASGAVIMDMTESLRLTGDIKGIEVVHVFSQVPGKVQEILIRQGQRVSRNQVVMRINRDIVGMDYMPAIVESPISGYVGTVLVDRGMTIAPSTPLAQVVNMSSVEAVVQIIEEDINRVKAGMAALVSVEAFPGRTFPGRVYKKSAVLNAASRTQEAHILVNNASLELKHGMFADIEIIIGKRGDLLAIPVDSVMRDEKDNAYCYAVENDTARKKPIVTGLTVRNFVEVRKGLDRNAVVVTLGKENVSDGERLKVYRDDAPKETQQPIRTGEGS